MRRLGIIFMLLLLSVLMVSGCMTTITTIKKIYNRTRFRFNSPHITIQKQTIHSHHKFRIGNYTTTKLINKKTLNYSLYAFQ